MKIYVIKSKESPVDLAEIRTDGNRLEFIVDNTDGHFPMIVSGSFQKLKRLVERSHHIVMEEPSKPTTYIQRFLLSTGELVEITTDGKTALLNGRLLEAKEKEALLGAIYSGQIQVKHKPQDMNEAIPVLPSFKKVPEKAPPPQYDKEMIDSFLKEIKSRKAARKNNSKEYDYEIENADYVNKKEAEDVKKLWYALKYKG